MPLNTDKSDLELWQGLQRRNKTDFSILYQRYSKLLFQYGFKICPDELMVQDAVQDLFIEIWNSRKNTEVNNLKFYLFKALRYKIFRNLKKEAQSSGDLHIDLSENSIEDSLTSLEIEAEQLSHLKNYIAELPERQREAINLKYFHCFSNEQIAEIMNINYQSVSNILFKALNGLRKKFNPTRTDIDRNV